MASRFGLSAVGDGGQITQVAGSEFYPLDWTSKGPGSNLVGGRVGGGGVTYQTRCSPNLLCLKYFFNHSCLPDNTKLSLQFGCFFREVLLRAEDFRPKAA